VLQVKFGDWKQVPCGRDPYVPVASYSYAAALTV